MFEQLYNIYVDSGKHKSGPYVGVSNINAIIVKEEKCEKIGPSHKASYKKHP